MLVSRSGRGLRAASAGCSATPTIRAAASAALSAAPTNARFITAVSVGLRDHLESPLAKPLVQRPTPLPRYAWTAPLLRRTPAPILACTPRARLHRAAPHQPQDPSRFPM